MRFVKFAVVGVANTAAAFVVFNLAAAGLHLPLLLANVVAWVAGATNSFVWNRLWTFADRPTGRIGALVLRFIAANLVALLVSTAIVAALQAAAGSPLSTLRQNLIEAAAIGGSLCVNFVISSRWVFRA
jgi:putative flippase GtrA